MKYLFTVLFFLSLSFNSLAAESKASEKAVVKVKGMVCSFCAQGIEKKFKDHKHVSKLKVNLENEEVVLWFKDGQRIEEEKLRALLKDSGYEVVKVEYKNEK